MKQRNSVPHLPPLWLFSDPVRLPDPCAVVARLPRGLCGVVFRPSPGPDQVEIGFRLRRICRDRRLTLVVAADWRVPGDWRLAAALGAGMHLRGGHRPRAPRFLLARTSSAHTPLDLLRSRRAGVCLAFLSPVFPTDSHPGGLALGALRWARWTRNTLPAALGGVDGWRVRRLPGCRAVGAIGAIGRP